MVRLGEDSHPPVPLRTTSDDGRHAWEGKSKSLSLDSFGHALASGDFNHDSHGDLAIGAPGEDEEVAGANGIGRVYVVYETGSGLGIDNDAFDQCSGSAGSCTSWNKFGAALAAAPLPNHLFIDGFESGGTLNWSMVN